MKTVISINTKHCHGVFCRVPSRQSPVPCTGSFIYVLHRFQASLPEADRHDTSAIYRKLSLAQLQREVPQLNWLRYLSAFLDADIDDNEPVVSYAMPYLVEMGRIIQKTDRRLGPCPVKMCRMARERQREVEGD
jgi:hypothetical protein